MEPPVAARFFAKYRLSFAYADVSRGLYSITRFIYLVVAGYYNPIIIPFI